MNMPILMLFVWPALFVALSALAVCTAYDGMGMLFVFSSALAGFSAGVWIVQVIDLVDRNNQAALLRLLKRPAARSRRK